MKRSLLQVDSLTAGYAGEQTIRNVTFSVSSDNLVGLIGPNGSGKTTLLRSCMGLLSMKTGSVKVAEKSVTAMSRRQIAKRITMVPQDTHIDFAFSVRELVAMGRYPHLGRFRAETSDDQKAIALAMHQTGIDNMAERPAVELSGGERQRVLIARALAQETPVILLDEPTSNLDLVHQIEVLKLVRKITQKGRCALAAIHDVSLASRFCDKLIVMQNGEIAAFGEPDQIISCEMFRELFHVTVDVITHRATNSLLVIPIESTRLHSE